MVAMHSIPITYKVQAYHRIRTCSNRQDKRSTKIWHYHKCHFLVSSIILGYQTCHIQSTHINLIPAVSLLCKTLVLCIDTYNETAAKENEIKQYECT